MPELGSDVNDSSPSTAVSPTDVPGSDATQPALAAPSAPEWDGYDRRIAERRIHDTPLAQGDTERRDRGHDRRDPQSQGAKVRPSPVPSQPWEAPRTQDAGSQGPLPAECPPILPGQTEPVDPTIPTPFT